MLLPTQKKILCKAARIIERRGHCKNALFLLPEPTKGPVCAVGAINAAVDHGNADWGSPSKDAIVCDIVNELNDCVRGKSLVGWNNAKGRRKSEVIALFRRLGECKTSR